MNTKSMTAPTVGSSALLGVKREYEEASKRLVEETKKAFPPGTVVAATLGKSRIIAEVVSSGGHWWHEPARLGVRNLKTGKMRHFSATYEGYAIEVITPNDY